MEFEWDPSKASQNLRKHKISFGEAATVFRDRLSIAIDDPDHSIREERFIIIGVSERQRLLMVAYTERGKRIRIISARRLNPTERRAYEKEIKNRFER
ncbi:BrnT family toxin [candidate division KSB1 bacterium]|nr:MAG: BrnT family toxin [candidate division KSB1 bacterium]MBC6949612.1 BrnT family toxin [candidate division KSB1 bacterium]MCE7943554.1 BrnT family toxin [Chlorobi bacterium CHB1]MDL1877244.1 BrnT family toxin [Cytophagia bacterium CHB2]RIK73077.1 MAG: hypothetical protein DCC62_18270 [candidate division KSB1 bacterium]